MLINQPVVAILDYRETVRWQDFDIAYFALQHLTEIFKVEFRRQVWAPTHLAVHEEQLSHILAKSMVGPGTTPLPVCCPITSVYCTCGSGQTFIRFGTWNLFVVID
jgi:hypothetical protein